MVIAGIDGPPNWPPPWSPDHALPLIDKQMSGGEFSFRRAHTHPPFEDRQVRRMSPLKDILLRKHNVAAHT
jgi:hypothetical protein